MINNLRPQRNMRISIFVDSQAAIKALPNPSPTVRLVCDCHEELQLLPGITGNGKAVLYASPGILAQLWGYQTHRY